MTAYLVTGGAGFIGSHLVKHLVEQGETVRVVDSFLTGSLENIAGVLERIELIEGDIRDEALMRRAMQGITYCLHHAALPSVPRSVEDPLLSHDINVKGTLSVLVAAKEAGVKRLVYASSSAVYGNSPGLPKREDMPARPLSPYAIDKYSGELYAQAFCSLYGLPTVCLRYFNIFGPGQDPQSPYAAVIPLFILAMSANTPAVVHGDGEQSRDFCYVDDVVAANLLACRAAAERVAGKTFNIACGKRCSIKELVTILNGVLGKRLDAAHIAPRNGDIRDSFADISRARMELKFEPRVEFAEGLRRTVEWFQRAP